MQKTPKGKKREKKTKTTFPHMPLLGIFELPYM
jgi:hypothetical protein